VNEPIVRELHFRALREESREVDFVCSTESVDSYGSIIKQNWDLRRFKQNPVVLWAHESRELPVGQASNTRVEKDALVATIKLATAKANPHAENVWQSILEGTLRGLSVGFYPREVRFEKHDDVEVMVLDDNELLELSVTPIPSNPEALAKLRSRALATKDPATPGAPPGTPANQRGEQKENHMDLEKENAALKTTVEKREAEVRAKDADLIEARKSLETERASVATLTREVEKARADAKTSEDRAAKAEATVVERDVDALVGVKIAPAERDEMLELAKSNRSLFDKLVAKRANLGGADGLARGGSVLGADKPQERAPIAGSDDLDNSKSFADFQKSLGN